MPQTVVTTDMTNRNDSAQGLASLRLSQGLREEAGAFMQSVLRILSETRLENLPPIDFRLQSAKLLIELGLISDSIKVACSLCRTLSVASLLRETDHRHRRSPMRLPSTDRERALPNSDPRCAR